MEILERPIRAIEENGEIILNSNFFFTCMPIYYKLGNSMPPQTYYASKFTNFALYTKGAATFNTTSRIHFNSLTDYNNFVGSNHFGIGAVVRVVASYQNEEIELFGRILSWDNQDVYTDIPWLKYSNHTFLEVQLFFENFTGYLKVYTGLHPSHKSNPTNEPLKYIATTELINFKNDENYNTGYMNISEVVKSKLNTYYEPITNDMLNLNQFTQSKITYAESKIWYNSVYLGLVLEDKTHPSQEWRNGEPNFEEDSYACSNLALPDEEFDLPLTTTFFDYSRWYNYGTGISFIRYPDVDDFVYVDLTTTNRYSRLLRIGAPAQLGIKLKLSINFTCTAQAMVQVRTCSYTDYETGSLGTVLFSVMKNAGTYTEDFYYQQSENTLKPPEVNQILFLYIYNKYEGDNTISVMSVKRTLQDEGCLPVVNHILGTRQFGDVYKNSIGNYEGVTTRKGDFLSFFKSLKASPNDKDKEISVIINGSNSNNPFFLELECFVNNTTTVFRNDEVIGSEGLYRMSVQNLLDKIYEYATLTSTAVGLTGKLRVGSYIPTVNNLYTGGSYYGNLDNYMPEGNFGDTDNYMELDTSQVEVGTIYTGHSPSLYGTGCIRLYSGSGLKRLSKGVRFLKPTYLNAGAKYLVSVWVKIDLFVETNISQTPHDYKVMCLGIRMDNNQMTKSATDLTLANGTEDPGFGYNRYDNLDIKIIGDIPDWKLIKYIYTPATSGNYYLSVMKAPTRPALGAGAHHTVGAQEFRIDSISVEEVGGDYFINDLPVEFTQSNGTTVKWLNSLGGWDSYIFEGRTKTIRKPKKNNRFRKDVFVNDFEGFSGTGMMFEKTKESTEVIILTTKLFDQETAESLKEIMSSLNVMYYNDKLSKFITVLVESESVVIDKQDNGSYNIAIECLLPNILSQYA